MFNKEFTNPYLHISHLVLTCFKFIARFIHFVKTVPQRRHYLWVDEDERLLQMSSLFKFPLFFFYYRRGMETTHKAGPDTRCALAD